MEATNITTDKKRRWGLIGAILSALAASVCCIGPLVLLGLGVSGAWIGNLSAMEPYRPIFMIITFGFLGYAYYKVFHVSKKTCDVGSVCAHPKADKINKIALIVVTILVLGMLAFPYAIPYLTTESQAAPNTAQAVATKTVTLDVKNMTCDGCVVTVTKSLKGVDGVINTKVTLDPPQATVVYDPSKVDVQKMSAATTNAGYPSSIQIKGGE